MKKVTIIQRGISKHRVSFYQKLKKQLADADIQLTLVYGSFSQYDQAKPDFTDISWGVKIQNRVLKILGKEVYWQPALKYALDSDLVIVEQANRLLLNYVLLVIRKFKGFKMAFWGHGTNFQAANPTGFLESFKSKYSRKVDWWFAYTKLSENAVSKSGFPRSQITIVENSTQTDIIQDVMQNTTRKQLNSLKHELGVVSGNVAIFCGGMYANKNIGLIIDVCKEVKARIDDFHVVFVGSGPDQCLVEEFARKSNWAHYVGPKFDGEQVPYFMMSSLQLMPGLVGLGIVDSFIMQTPIFTLDHPNHSPEIIYLENGINGVMTNNNQTDYVNKIVEYLKSPEMVVLLKKGCAQSAQKYTVENMVNNFSNGIEACFDGEI